MTNEIIGAITVIVAIATYLPYLYDTIRGKVTPHPFSWTIWLTLSVVAYAAQISDNAGPGSWMNAVVILIGLFIVAASFKYGFKNIKKIDVFVFALGVTAIPLWIITDDALWSVILISFANTIAYIPTFRKSYHKPHEEALYVYGINFFRHGASIFAMTNLSLITSLFPFILVLNNGALALFLIWRRRQLRA